MALLRHSLQKHSDVSDNGVTLSDAEYIEIVNRTDGYSGSDLRQLLEAAAMGPIRDHISNRAGVRDISVADFVAALTEVKASNVLSAMQQYGDWNRDHGSWQNSDVLHDD